MLSIVGCWIPVDNIWDFLEAEQVPSLVSILKLEKVTQDKFEQLIGKEWKWIDRDYDSFSNFFFFFFVKYSIDVVYNISDFYALRFGTPTDQYHFNIISNITDPVRSKIIFVIIGSLKSHAMNILAA